jgi:hypothetical protein
MDRLRPQTSSGAPTADAGISGKGVPHENVPNRIARSRLPRGTALTELEFLDQLFLWATNMRDNPEAFFTGAELSEIDPPAEKVPDEVDPYEARAQEDLDFSRELLDWAENIVGQDEENEQKQKSGQADLN